MTSHPVPESPRLLDGGPAVWRALGHPARHRIRAVLTEQGPATATGLARALGTNTGSTSYHLRVLAEAGLIEQDTTRGHGKERWWRVLPVDIRQPAGGGLSHDTLAARAARHAARTEDDHRLLDRVQDEADGGWAGVCRSQIRVSASQLAQFVDDFTTLVARFDKPPSPGSEQPRTLEVRLITVPTAEQT